MVPTGRLCPVNARRNRRLPAFWVRGEGRTDVGPTRLGFHCSLLAGSFFGNHAKIVVSSQSLRRCYPSAWSEGEARQPEFVGTKSTGFVSRNAGIDDFHMGSNDHIVEIK